MAFKKDDVIVSFAFEGVERQIISFEGTYYLWKYPDIKTDHENIFDSRNSTDPLLVNWHLKQK